ncbi:MAG TPA: glycogen synthase [Acidimicrobiales bacterium]|nr:glycogen synthase [Acidimicrobiales bacterium]
MKVAMMTREYPPEVYGGAGVHVEQLATALAPLVDVAVHCFGAPRSSPLVAGTYTPWPRLVGPDADGVGTALGVLSVDLAMAAAVGDADLCHSHTWYANLAGHLAKLGRGTPHVVTTHSLEPLRPWKVEQLGGGYALSSFAERTAIEGADRVIAVSHAMARDVLACYPTVDPDRVEVVHNGVDAALWHRDPAVDALHRHGVDPDRPYVAFVGRVTRQKGITHLLEAAPSIDPRAQLVVCAGAADSAAIAAEVESLLPAARGRAGGLVWIDAMLPRPEVAQLLSHATCFVCPSIYEPFGLVNVEAMACGAAVVASAVGGIPEVVLDGETGLLVPVELRDDDERLPVRPDGFAAAIAAAVNSLVDDPARARSMGAAGRQRVEETFSWAAIAARTVETYRRALDS